MEETSLGLKSSIRILFPVQMTANNGSTFLIQRLACRKHKPMCGPCISFLFQVQCIRYCHRRRRHKLSNDRLATTCMTLPFVYHLTSLVRITVRYGCVAKIARDLNRNNELTNLSHSKFFFCANSSLFSKSQFGK